MYSSDLVVLEDAAEHRIILDDQNRRRLDRGGPTAICWCWVGAHDFIDHADSVERGVLTDGHRAVKSWKTNIEMGCRRARAGAARSGGGGRRGPGFVWDSAGEIGRR